MRERIEGILLGILFGALGAWMALAGLGIGKANIIGLKGPDQIVAGLMFFFAGAWSFFSGGGGQGAAAVSVVYLNREAAKNAKGDQRISRNSPHRTP